MPRSFGPITSSSPSTSPSRHYHAPEHVPEHARGTRRQPPRGSRAGGDAASRRPVYAYSFDRLTYRGTFPTRQAALAEGERVAGVRRDRPEAVYVARRAESPSLTSLGFASAALDTLAAHGLRPSLVSSEAVASLDEAIASAVGGWLRVRGVERAETASVEAISEHPLPPPPHVFDGEPGPREEVHILGPEE